jgi:hypothetical protein
MAAGNSAGALPVFLNNRLRWAPRLARHTKDDRMAMHRKLDDPTSV